MSVIGIDLERSLDACFEKTSSDYIPPPNPSLRYLVGELKADNHTLCIWSTYADHIVREWLRTYLLEDYFDHINCSPYPTESGKAAFDQYLSIETQDWNPEGIKKLCKKISAKEKSGRNYFSRSTYFLNQNPKLYHQGVGKLAVDMFEPHWRAAWEEYSPDKPSILLTICSHAKPYSKSYIHMAIRRALHEKGQLDGLDYAHISNAGIVPSRAENDYPFSAYDWNCAESSAETSDYHQKTIVKRFKYWYDKYGPSYKKVFVYLRANEGRCLSIKGLLECGAVGSNLILISANQEFPPLPFAANPDEDDCLTRQENLALLTEAIEKG